MSIRRFVKDLVFDLRYKEGKEYKVPLSRIKIQPAFEKTPIGREKWLRKMNYYRRNKRFESQVVLDRNFVLLDGYSTYCVAKRMSVPFVSVVFDKSKVIF